MTEYISNILGREFDPWEIFAILGLLTFSSRFIVQWIVSEIRKESVIPVVFWYLSIQAACSAGVCISYFRSLDHSQLSV